MALYKLCKDKGRARDRCAHAWWGSWGYKGRLYRRSLQQWSGEEITSKAQAQVVFERMKVAIRAGQLERRAAASPAEGPLTVAAFAAIYLDCWRSLKTAEI